MNFAQYIAAANAAKSPKAFVKSMRTADAKKALTSSRYQSSGYGLGASNAARRNNAISRFDIFGPPKPAPAPAARTAAAKPFDLAGHIAATGFPGLTATSVPPDTSYTTTSASPNTHTYSAPSAPAASTFDPYGYLSGNAGMSAAPAAPAFDMSAFMADYQAQMEAQQAAMQAQMQEMTASFQQQMQAQQQAMAQQQEEMLKQQQQYAQQMMINQAQSERDPADVRIGSNRRKELARAGTGGYFGRKGIRLGNLNVGSGGPSRIPQASGSFA